MVKKHDDNVLGEEDLDAVLSSAISVVRLFCIQPIHSHMLAVIELEWTRERMSRISRPTRHITGRFRDESFQAINFTGTDNQTVTKRKYTKHKITNANTNKPVLEKTWNAQKPKPITVHL